MSSATSWPELVPMASLIFFFSRLSLVSDDSQEAQQCCWKDRGNNGSSVSRGIGQLWLGITRALQPWWVWKVFPISTEPQRLEGTHKDHWVQLLALPGHPSNPTLSLRALSNHSWSSGSCKQNVVSAKENKHTLLVSFQKNLKYNEWLQYSNVLLFVMQSSPNHSGVDKALTQSPTSSVTWDPSKPAPTALAGQVWRIFTMHFWCWWLGEILSPPGRSSRPPTLYQAPVSCKWKAGVWGVFLRFLHVHLNLY